MEDDQERVIKQLERKVEQLQERLAVATAVSPFLPGRFYGVSEVAGILGVSRKTVWKWAKEGNMPPIHGACRRLRGDQLARWVEGGKPWREIENA